MKNPTEELGFHFYLPNTIATMMLLLRLPVRSEAKAGRNLVRL